MALLKNTETHEITVLLAQHTVGRNVNACNTTIDAEDVSRSHATLYWSQGEWYLRDHSRNGTLIDGMLVRESVQCLKTGVSIQFGTATASHWVLLNTDAPCSYLQQLGGKDKVLLNECSALPDEQQPEALFFQDQDHVWFLESASGTAPLKHGDVFRVGSTDWMFLENESLPETKDHGAVVHDAVFCFYLSPDEEDVRLVLDTPAQLHDLGHRTYNVMLLTLVRRRLSDMGTELFPDDQGWMTVESLERQVGKELGREVDSYYINLQVFRLRKQLAELKPYGHLFCNAIVRRPGEIRFAFPKMKVIKEGMVVGEHSKPQSAFDTKGPLRPTLN